MYSHIPEISEPKNYGTLVLVVIHTWNKKKEKSILKRVLQYIYAKLIFKIREFFKHKL